MVVDGARERVDLRDPVAAHRVAAIAQRAIDELDVVFATAEHDERYRGLSHAVTLFEGEEPQCKQRARGLRGTRVTNAARALCVARRSTVLLNSPGVSRTSRGTR